MDSKKLEEIRQAVGRLASLPNTTRLTFEEAAARARAFGARTEFGGVSYVTQVKTMSTGLTVYLGSERVETVTLTQKKKDIKKSVIDTISSVHSYLSRVSVAQIDCAVGQGPGLVCACRLLLSTYRPECVRLAHMTTVTLFESNAMTEPEMLVVVVPEWNEKDRQVLVFPEIGVTYILGTDFFGEIKNAFLRMVMWRAKQNGMLGLHAGTKIARARTADGGIRRMGVVMFGIAATGKTTHSCHDHGLDQPGEEVEILQDDVILWCPDGGALGTENGFYIKTDGLAPESQPLLYLAATRESAVLENVLVDFKGRVFFADRTLTPNGHAIVQREALGQKAAAGINLPPIDELDGLALFFMTRDYTALPIVSKLTPEQAAVSFMMSESIDALAGDQSAVKHGGITASPLIIGDISDEINRFYEFVKSHQGRIECFMLNTGGVGETVEHGLDGARKVLRKVTRVQIGEMASIIRAILRGEVEWRDDPNWMLRTPSRIEGIDISRFDPASHYDQEKLDSLVAGLRLERATYAEQFSGLDPLIRGAVEF